MKPVLRLLCIVCLLAAGARPAHAQAGLTAQPVFDKEQGIHQPASLAEVRRGFRTRLILQEQAGRPVPWPPEGILEIIKYPSPAGELSAYYGRPPADPRKHPAMVWLMGSLDNSIDNRAWLPAPADKDESASVFREAGIPILYPSLRGGNDNPGFIENFYGEVDDILAARDWLAAQPNIDPARIYLGGHDTGGTLALLAAECGGAFRGVFAFGPVYGPRGYDTHHLFYDLGDEMETYLRAPYIWLDGVTGPTFVFEGVVGEGRLPALKAMAANNRNGNVHFYPVANATHVGVLQPVSRLIARKILAAAPVAFTEQEIADAVAEK